MHLIIDGYGGDFQKIQNIEPIYQLLDSYPSRIGMTKISSPQVSKHTGSKFEEESISGFVLLAESHVSIHIFPNQSYINIDVFSCRDFDAEKAIKGFQEGLGLTEIRSYVLNRASGMSVKPYAPKKLKRLEKHISD
jgi:S-adenosylmethionine decarboxylase